MNLKQTPILELSPRLLYGISYYLRIAYSYRPLYGTGVNSGIGERLDQHCTVSVELASSLDPWDYEPTRLD